MLDVKSISRRYGDLKAVDEVSFAIGSGEIVGLLGHNGAGKTTIMKMLSGYLEPDSGTIHFQNKLLESGDNTLQKALGYLPENLPVYPELSVAGYLQYAAELKGITGKQQRNAIRTVTEATDLTERFLSPIATLSRGMKQRVGVAQALLGSPTLLILDEPTNGLDPAQTEQMRSLIKTISQSATVILSTHIMQEVEATCSRALIIRQGKLAADTQLNDMNSSNTISLQTTSTPQVVNEALGKESWFRRIEPSATAPVTPDAQSLTLTTAADVDINEIVAKCVNKLVSHSIPVLSIHSDRKNLQSLFLDINAGTAATEHTPEVTHAA